jgi:hypothetical protein
MRQVCWPGIAKPRFDIPESPVTAVATELRTSPFVAWGYLTSFPAVSAIEL